VKDNDETDVDCGGSKAPACADGKACLVAGDCTSGVCTSAACKAPTHVDGVRNGDETGVDCGGASAPRCPTGQGCAKSADCNNIVCDPNGHVCLAASNTDGLKNGTETGVDCGGPTAPNRCPAGQGCAADADCMDGSCDVGKTGLCLAPSSTDGRKNGTETDIDCGGGAPTNAPKCAAGKTCVADSDCASTVCNYAGVCAPAPSCRVQNGGDTCGAGETGIAGAVHESCCASVKLPGSSVAIDKYEITAGRMREFIRATGGDVHAWVAANPTKTAQIPNALVPYLPTGLDTPVMSVKRCGDDGKGCSSTNQAFGVHDYLGNEVFLPDRPCPSCGQGCWIGTGVGGNGHPTYWWDDDTQKNQYGSQPRSTAFGANAQTVLDQKSLNCTPQILFAAFCAWDGGRLPTQAELGGIAGAWGPGTMPWGNTPTFRDTVNGVADPGRKQYTFPDVEDPCLATPCFLVPMFDGTNLNFQALTLNTTNFNPFPSSPDPYQVRFMYPLPLDSAKFVSGTQDDQAWAIAEPGRMRNDFRKVGPGATDGYFDVAGNLIEATATIRPCTTNADCGVDGTNTAGMVCGADHLCYDDANHNGWPLALWVGGSFEGHTPENHGAYNLSVFTKYGKQGARCAR
jgi:hypothetical protein